MNKETYTYLLANPQEIDKIHLGDISLILDKYPYFQSARALQLKAYKKENSFLYNDALKKTAAFTTDRDVLFSYITSTAFVQDHISQAIMAHESQWNDIEVVHQDISKEVSLALDREMKVELKKANAILDPHLFEKKKIDVFNILENSVNRASEIVSNDTTTLKETTVKIVENAPLLFSKDDTHSFTEWLKLSNTTPIQETEQVLNVPISENKNAESRNKKEAKTKAKKLQQIEKFIQEQPKIVPKPKNEPFATLSITDSGSPKALMTETLAKMYLQQKKYDKAIQAYKILILKYPEKSGFFADQIRAIKNLDKKQEQ